MSGSTASSQNEEARDLDYEKDSLHIMPLHILPLKTPALLKARMVKNIQLDSMVELFKDDNSGSGQVEPSRLGRMFEWPVGEKHPDGVLIAKLSLLQSFDVYSLRIQLRSFGIKVDEIEHLQLSGSRRKELDKYMRVFTRPLMDLVFSKDQQDGIADLGNLLATIHSGNNKAALENLRRLSGKLKIILTKLPAFLSDYGDVFLSLAYFKDHFDRIVPRIETFIQKVDTLKKDEIIRNDAGMRESLDHVCNELNELTAHIAGRIQSFDKLTESMWANLSEETFRKVKIMIESNHGTIGGMLCGLQIKIDGFEEKFAESETSNLVMADYISSYVKPGLERIRNIERSARLAESR